MDLLLGLILIILALCVGYVIGDVIGFRVGWDKGRDYCMKWYDPHQYEWEKRFEAKLKHKESDSTHTFSEWMDIYNKKNNKKIPF